MSLTKSKEAQLRLLTDALNNFSVSVFVAGGATPIVNYMIDGKIPGGYATGVVLACTALSIVAHWTAWYLLGSLDN